MRVEKQLTEFQSQALQWSLAQLGLNARTVNAIETAFPAVKTVEDLLMLNPEDLVHSVVNFGNKTLEEVFNRLSDIGFCRGNVIVRGETAREKMIDRSVSSWQDVVGQETARFWLLECSGAATAACA